MVDQSTNQAEEIVVLKDDFYKDRFSGLMFIIISIWTAIVILILLSIYLYFDKPKPITFPVYNEMRILRDVPVNDPYISKSDLLQWVGTTLPRLFQLDFKNYNEQMNLLKKYFTQAGWKIFLNQLNIYANYNNVQSYKMFISSAPDSAPFIVKEGLLAGKYAWWVQMPLKIHYVGPKTDNTDNIDFQLLVTRVSTENNLDGIAIDNVIVLNPKKGSGSA